MKDEVIQFERQNPIIDRSAIYRFSHWMILNS